MTRKRKRKPVDLGLYITCRHPASEGNFYEDGDRYNQNLESPLAKGQNVNDLGIVIGPHVDEDGYHISLNMEEMGGLGVAMIAIQRGTDAHAMARLLRCVADLVEHHPQLLTLPRGMMGDVKAGEVVLDDWLCDTFDENGNISDWTSQP